MVSVHRTIPQPVDAVFAAVVDPETYPHWLVGARDMRRVEDRWPEVGSRFHHRGFSSVNSEVLAWPPRSAVLTPVAVASSTDS